MASESIAHSAFGLMGYWLRALSGSRNNCEILNLIPLELIRSNRNSNRKASEAHLIDKAMTLELRGINRRDELN